MLLDLPPELRTQIYDYLLPPDPLSHPINSIALTSVSHRPPLIASLLVCQSLTKELLSQYYDKATFKLVLSHTFNFYRVDPCLDNFNKHPILQRIKHVELVFFCDGILVRNYPSFGPDRASQEVGRRAERAVEVLRNATALARVKVSLVDPGGHWGNRSDMVRPVRQLSKRGVAVEIGDVLGLEEAERDNLIRAMKTELDMMDQTEQQKPSSSFEPGPANSHLPAVVLAEELQCPTSPSSRFKAALIDCS